VNKYAAFSHERVVMLRAFAPPRRRKRARFDSASIFHRARNRVTGFAGNIEWSGAYAEMTERKDRRRQRVNR
jgi:hypothetical protein